MAESFPKSPENLPTHSNLSPELQEYVHTPEFKAWFGDWQNDPAGASKMLDENGEPKLFFSGRPRGITELSGDYREHTGPENVGFYLTTIYSKARSYASMLQDNVAQRPTPGSVYSCFLDIRQPHHVQNGDGIDTTSVVKIPDFTDGYINDKMQEIVVFDPQQIMTVHEQPVDEWGRPVEIIGAEAMKI